MKIFSPIIIILLSLIVTRSFAAPISEVFRADKQPPSEIFKNGFVAPGTNDLVIDHVLGSSCKRWTTAFIPTSESQHFLQQNWAKDMLYMDTDSDYVYIYRIRPSHGNFFSAYSSLMSAYNRTGNTFYRTTARKFQNQQEWLALHNIPASSIISVDEFQRNRVSDLPNLEYTRTILNPDYIEDESSDLPEEGEAYTLRQLTLPYRTTSLAVNSSEEDVSSCFSMCFRRQRSTRSLSQSSKPQCFYDEYAAQGDSIFLSSMDSSLYKSSVPWRSITKQNHYDYVEQSMPDFCSFSTDGYQTIYVKCQSDHPDHRFFRQFAVIIGGGGKNNTWFNKVFVNPPNDDTITIKASDVPVLGTNYTLADYKSSWWFSGIFTGSYSAWWSYVNVVPIYPNIDPKYYESYIKTGMQPPK